MTKLSCGIVGLPNVGKSTLFNALTKKAAASSNYPFCTIDPNVGNVDLSDPRLGVLSNLSNSKQIIYASVQFTDIAGLVKGASKGEGLGNQFLANIRETEAICHVVRCFDSTDIHHVSGKIDPIDDVETVELELVLSDLERATSQLQKFQKQARGAKEPIEIALLKKVVEHLDKDLPLRTLMLTEEELEHLQCFQFLTSKKVLYVANISEDDLPSMENDYVQKLREYAKTQGADVLAICAKLEEEIAQLDPDEQQDFLESVGLEEPGLDRLASKAFSLLGLMTFFTTGEMETRAWTILKGSTAPVAAGKIHTDIQKGFIRAEVISYQDIVACQGRVAAKEKGLMRLEGKEYIVQDGDVINFLHN